jgi:hypothetical protein
MANGTKNEKRFFIGIANGGMGLNPVVAINSAHAESLYR